MFFTIIQLIADEIENLARIYGNMMNALAYRILQNHHSAEDAVQDALVSLSHNMNKLDSLHSKRSYNYIYTVTQNAALTIMKKEKNQNVDGYIENDEIANLPGELDINAFSDKYGFSPRTSEALGRLSPLDRDILCYRYGAGYTPGEIAKYIGESRDFVYKRIQRAQKELARILDEEVER